MAKPLQPYFESRWVEEAHEYQVVDLSETPPRVIATVYDGVYASAIAKFLNGSLVIKPDK